MQLNTEQNNFEYGHFLYSVTQLLRNYITCKSSGVTEGVL